MYDLVKQLILPPASLILLILVGLVLGRRYRRLGTSVATLGLLALYAAGTPFCGALLLSNLERATPPDLTKKKRHTA